METDIETRTTDAVGDGATPGIVRVGPATAGRPWPTVAAFVLTVLIVAAAHLLTTRLDGWGAGPATDTSAPLSALVDAVVTLAVGVRWPLRYGLLSVAGIAVGAAAIAWSARRTGLPHGTAVLVGLIAAAGPFAWTHATLPTGLAVLFAGSALLAAAMPTPSPSRARGLLAVGAGALVVLWLAGWGWPLPAGRAVVGDLGGPGLVLVLLGVVRGFVWPVGAVVAGAALAGPLGPAAQTAVMLPWAWMLVVVGCVGLGRWRGTDRRRWSRSWLWLGLSAWLLVQAGGRDWAARADEATLRAFWAEGVADATSGTALVATADASTSRLIRAWRGETASDDAVLRPGADVAGQLTSGDYLLPDPGRDVRWRGIDLHASPTPLAPLASVLGHLPPGLMVIVGVSQAAVPTLAPDDWQALGRLGASPATAGPTLARAIIGVTGGRRSGTEVASPSLAAQSRLPGDVIAPTSRPSPVDVRIEADAHGVALFERSRRRAAASGLLVAVYRPDGRPLAHWLGTGGRMLGAAAPGSAGLALTRVDRVLPCRAIAAHQETRVDALAQDGALGLTVTGGARVSVTSVWAAEGPAGVPRLVTSAAAASAEDGDTLHVTAGGQPIGIDLRGRPDAVTVISDTAGRVCAAPSAPGVPVVGTHDPVHVAPDDEAVFARGWHASEPGGGGRHFRWMAGGRGVLLVAGAEAPGPAGWVVEVDAQSVGQPGATDEVRLLVNGQPVGSRRWRGARAGYRWDVPAAALRRGLNELALETTLTVRPSDLGAGGDGRLLGLAVFDVTFSRTSP